MFTDAELNRFINTANTALNDAALRILHAIIYEDLYGQLPPNCIFSKVRYWFFDSKYTILAKSTNPIVFQYDKTNINFIDGTIIQPTPEVIKLFDTLVTKMDATGKLITSKVVAAYTSQLHYGNNSFLTQEYLDFADKLLSLSECDIREIYPIDLNVSDDIIAYLYKYGGNLENIKLTSN